MWRILAVLLLSMSNEDAQFLESRQFSVREIARWFRLPPHLLADIADSSVLAMRWAEPDLRTWYPR